MKKEPYIGFAHDDSNIVVHLFAFMASHTDEARLVVAQRVPTAGVELADVKIVVWQANPPSVDSDIVFVSQINETFYTSNTTN